MIRYLLEDCTGLASGIEYGKQGDQVTVINIDGDMALVDGGKELYHIRVEKLNEEKPDEVMKPERVQKPEALPSKRKTSSIKPRVQNKLF